MPEPTRTELLQGILRSRFGLEGFRGLQSAVVERVLSGRDTLGLMPTGAGKSLCYQLPALLLPGLTLVVSPLIALMRDQERRLAQLGIAARALTSAQTPTQRAAVAAELAAGQLRILLLSPERALAPDFLRRLADMLPIPKVSLIVVDEAHCIVDWGREFRPVYGRLGEIRRTFPTATMLALTASADRRVQQHVQAVLGLPDDALLKASFDRPELFYRVALTPAPARLALAFLQQHHPGSSAVFYCRRRWQTMVLARFLMAHGVPACPYHAGLGAEQRRACEEWFLQTPNGVIAATIAFGMGIDKPDIRLVVHFGPAATLAAYYQESGRAGRDGKPADALLLLPAHHTTASACGEDRSEEGGSIQEFLYGRGCRRAVLLAAFDELHPEPCGGCDHCRPDWHPPPELRENRLGWVPSASAAPRRRAQPRHRAA